MGDYFSCERATSYSNRHTAVGGDAIAELPVIVTAPAGDSTVLCQCTRMPSTGGDVGDYFSCERATSYGNRHTAVGGGAISELPVFVAAPAGDSTVLCQCTRIFITDRDLGASLTGV